ncbi:MAG: CotH kinase family protein [Cryomorphaceae bacterium]|nr:CotH kinase family protein [Cryomorphaceae bacterium]
MRFCFTGVLILIYLVSNAQTPPPVVINEFLASNSNTISDNTNQYEDWIELHNTGTTQINLQNYYLSDDPTNLTKHQITQNIAILTGGYLLYWASGDTSRGNMHTNFSLSASQGESVILTMPDGVTIVDSIHFGPQTTDISKGRTTDGAASWSYFSDPTPESTNNTSIAYNDILDPPTFSQNGGFYNNPFGLSLSSSDTGVSIYYTLDGSFPDPNRLNGEGYQYKNQYPQFPATPATPFLTDTMRTFIYNNPIPINNRTSDTNRTSAKSSTFNLNPDYIPDTLMRKGTVVRAIAVRSGAISSPVATETYFVGSDLVGRYTLPVISISTDENLLFGYHDGIYAAGVDFESWRSGSGGTAQGNSPANWHRSGRSNEYPVNFEYFDESGNKQVGQIVGARIHGGWSRARRRKTFRLYARNEYGPSTINYPIFNLRAHTEYKRLLLRNSGNDELLTSFRDAAIQNLVNHLHFDIQQSEAAIVFINGEFWGHINIREFQNRHYINRMFGLDPSEIDFLTPLGVANDGNALHFNQMRAYMISNNLSNDSLFAEVEKQMDIEDFTDYAITGIFSRNTDWPVANIKWWRKRVPYTPNAPRGHDGRWRWLLYDTDFGYGLSGGIGDVDHNTLNHARLNGDVGILLRNLWDNQKYKEFFINRYCDLMNTCFLPSHTHQVFDSMKAIYEPYMHEHILRWGHYNDMQEWYDNIQLMHDWADARPAFARIHLRNQFSLVTDHDLTVDVNDTLRGHIRVNTITILDTTVGIPKSPYPWTGVYFRHNPVELEAIANWGYRFAFWEVGSDTLYDEIISLSLTGNTLAKAYFSPDTGIVCGPEPHVLANCPYVFDNWPSQSQAGDTPYHIQFVYFDENDPSDQAVIAGETNGAYNLTSRTRIIGLNDDGLALINTGNSQGNPGFPGTRLGGIILNLNTENMNRGFVQWVGGTLEYNAREYRIRLQYRLGSSGPWINFPDSNGNPVEYIPNATLNHSEVIGPYPIPTDLVGRECIQLMWRYYHTGNRRSTANGTRDFLRIDDIIVGEGHVPQKPLSPNAAHPSVVIDGKSIVAGDETTNYSVIGSPGANYHWTINNGQIINGQGSNSIDVEWASSGVGLVQLEMVNSDSCEMHSSKTVNISGLSTSKHDGESTSIFPNPTTDEITIERQSDWASSSTAILIDGAGRVVMQKELSPNRLQQLSIDVPSGNYHLQIMKSDGKIIFNQKLQVVK